MFHNNGAAQRPSGPDEIKYFEEFMRMMLRFHNKESKFQELQSKLQNRILAKKQNNGHSEANGVVYGAPVKQEPKFTGAENLNLANQQSFAKGTFTGLNRERRDKTSRVRQEWHREVPLK